MREGLSAVTFDGAVRAREVVWPVRQSAQELLQRLAFEASGSAQERLIREASSEVSICATAPEAISTTVYPWRVRSSEAGRRSSRSCRAGRKTQHR